MDVELVLDSRASVGEGPTWDPITQTLVWVDIRGMAVHRFDPGTGSDLIADVGQPVGAVGICTSGDLVLALRDGFGLWRDGAVSLVAPVEMELADTRMNDGKVDPRGRFWAGTMALDTAPGRGSLYRLSPDLRVERVLTGLTISNGMDWTADGTRMYFIDSGAGRIDVFDYDLASGAIENRRPFVEIPPDEGQPDGMTLDGEGHVWVAIWGGSQVRRYAPDGRLDAVLRMPVSLVTSCAFGGRDLEDLYITTSWARLSSEDHRRQPHAGGLYRCRPGVPGRQPSLFALQASAADSVVEERDHAR